MNKQKADLANLKLLTFLVQQIIDIQDRFCLIILQIHPHIVIVRPDLWIVGKVGEVSNLFSHPFAIHLL